MKVYFQKSSVKMGNWFGFERMTMETAQHIETVVVEDVPPAGATSLSLSASSPLSTSSGTMSIYHGSQCSTLVPPSPESAAALDQDYGRVWRGR